MTALDTPAGLRHSPGLRIAEGRLDLWVLRTQGLDRGPQAMVTDELDEGERRRGASFVHLPDRLTYRSAHVALRRVLAAYTGTPPGELPLGRDRCSCCGRRPGRPVLHGSPVHFSLSRGVGVVLIGVAPVVVGVDLQQVLPLETAALSATSLHPAEQQELAQLTPPERTLAFSRLWTRKEAYFKGLGSGLTRDLAVDYLGERPGQDAPARPHGWLVHNVNGIPAHTAGVALRTTAPYEVRTHRLPSACLYTDDATELITGVGGVRTRRARRATTLQEEGSR
ncbi:4'-phosphopantetheinyl transferase superfamily protein [Streptomyces sp. T-3]|nr:4'-phosphopantetheinyl transferase superfamily protein [Streptomyces sp. T-3]